MGAATSSVGVPAVDRKDIRFKIPILVYHHIRPYGGWAKSSWSTRLSVSPKNFDKQMQWIVDHDYTTINLDTYVKIRNGEIPGPVKPVVITFDDGNLNSFTEGLPVLEKHRLTATWYIIPQRFGARDFISKDQVKELAAKGMDIQSHTLNHLLLTRLPQNELDWELREGKRVLEELVGKPVLHLAYPATTHNAFVRQRTVAAGYATATLMDPRIASEKDDLIILPRIMMEDGTRLEKWLP